MLPESNPGGAAFCISLVEQDRKDRHRYHIYAEGKEKSVLCVHEDILIRFRLLKGQWVMPEDAAKIEEADGKHKAYALAIGYLATKPRTSKEIEQYLGRKIIAPEVITIVIERLQLERLVDDGEYAKQFARQRLSNHLKGRLWIKQELLQRGINREEASEALDALDPVAETEAALKAAHKKWPSLKGDFREKKMRLYQFLARRGYPGHVIKEAIKAVALDDDGFEDGDWLDN